MSILEYMNKLNILEEKAKGIVQAVANDPEGRYQLRYAFYEKYGDPLAKGTEGLGNSELAFIRWEIKRGVLNPLEGDHPGSPWWRAVNSQFLYLATLAQLIDTSGETFQELPNGVAFWLAYIAHPNERTWYKAHNSSIIAGYLEANDLAFRESVHEQYFMNIVLYRLLYAQSMVEGMSFGLLGMILGNPRGFAVDLITHIEAFYPSHYPMTKKDIKYVMHKGHNLEGIIEDIFDKVFILPHLDKLYDAAALWNNTPSVPSFVKDNVPVYPIVQHDEDLLHFNNQLTHTAIPTA